MKKNIKEENNYYLESGMIYLKRLTTCMSIMTFLLFIVISLTLFFGLWYFKDKKELESNSKEENISSNEENINVKNYYMEETFVFDNLEITLKHNYTFEKLNNIYSIYNGREVIKIPVEIKNLTYKDYSLNLYYYTLYNQIGSPMDEVAAYFDESLYYAKDLKSGMSYTKYLYFIYEGDGSYSVKFKKGKEEANVEFYIRKLKTNDNQEKQEDKWTL